MAQARANYGSGVDLDIKAEAEWAGMIYADRGVYRPGETMKLGGVFRKVDAAGVTIVPDQNARVLVEDAQGEKVFDGRAKLGAFGEVALDVPLSKTSHIGNATIKVELGRRETQLFSQDVLLAAYKASEFKVAVDADKPAYVRGDTGQFDVHGEYLYGAPMGGQSYRTGVIRHAISFQPSHSGRLRDERRRLRVRPPRDEPFGGAGRGLPRVARRHGAREDDGSLHVRAHARTGGARVRG